MAKKQRGARQGGPRPWRSRRRTAPGTPPGTMRADPAAPSPRIHVMSYSANACSDTLDAPPGEIAERLKEWPVTWAHVEGLGDPAVLRAVGNIVSMHPLALEDVVNVHQRPKVEHYDHQLFIVARYPSLQDALVTSQWSMLLGSNYLLTFSEGPTPLLEPLRRRLAERAGPLREKGADYLAYSVLDYIVDAYFPIVEYYGEQIDALEERILVGGAEDTSETLHRLRHELLMLRRAVWPQRDAVNALSREFESVITPETRVFLRDCYDHSVQLMDLLEVCREITTGLADLNLARQNNRIAEVMQLLTVVAAVFIPLTFIVGVYGMNFDADVSPWNMPELRWYWGYPLVLSGMAGLAALCIYGFWRWNWLKLPASRKRRDESGPEPPGGQDGKR